MFVSLELLAPKTEPQLLVPSEAVITTGERTVVIVANADGTFAPSMSAQARSRTAAR
jgi:Cu(I)/Ag(I) efflux system membrane fusion protein